MLGTTLDFKVIDAGLFQLHRQCFNKAGDVLFAIFPAFLQRPGNAFVGIGFNNTKRQILKLPLELCNTETVGKRRVYFQRFTRDRSGRIVVLL